MPTATEIRRASKCSLDEITTALKRGYEGYHFPYTRTPAAQAERMMIDNIVLDGSFLLFGAAGPMGAALFGVRGRHGWCSDLALAPAYRGQGAGRELMDRLIAEARARKLTSLWLEVLTNNTPAFQLYQSLGFRIEREVVTYSGRLEEEVKRRAFTGPLLIPDLSGEPGEETPAERLPVPIEAAAVLRRYDQFQFVRQCWEFDRPLLEHLATAGKLLALAIPGEAAAAGPDACLLYTQEGRLVQLLAFGARPGADVTGGLELATVLLSVVADQHPGAEFLADEVPPGDPLGPVLEAAGCPTFARLFEMRLAL